MSDQPFEPYPEDSARAERAVVAGPLEQPSSMRTAVMLMRAGAVVSLIGIVVTLLTLATLKDDIRSSLAHNSPTYTQSDVDTFYKTAVALSVILGLVAIGLWLWMASMNGKGRSWARIVATVLGILNVLSFLSTVTVGNATASSLVFALVNVVIGVTTLVFLYRPESTAYYKANSRT
jgi:hypothetical protein